MRGERLKIWSGLLTVSLVWGSTWLAIKIGLEVLPPFLAAGVRFVLASMILYTIIRVRNLHVLRTPDAKKVYGIMGILSFGVPFALVYWSEQYVPSALGSILFAAYPFWVGLFAHFYLRNEPLDGFKAAGIALGFLGIVMIFWGDVGFADKRAVIGMGAMVLSPILQAFALVFIKKHGQQISPIVMNFIGMSMGAGFLLPLSFLTERWRGITWDATAVGSIIYLAVFGSVVAFVTYYWLLKRVQAVYLSLTSFINPVVAAVLGWVVLGESLGTTVLAGAAMVLAGILVANGRYFFKRLHSSS